MYVCVCKSVCKCVCRCADLALLSEGCIRVACRKGHRTTVVLQKKKKRAAEPSESEFSHPGRKDSRKGGRGYIGVGESGCVQMEAREWQTWGRMEGDIGGRVEKIARTQRYTQTHTHTMPKRQPHRSTVHPRLTTRPPSLRCLSAPPKLMPMGFRISVLQQWANYSQAPSPN